MPQKNIVPPPMKKSVLLKLKLKKLLPTIKEAAKGILSLALIIGSLGYLIVKGPEIHGMYLREAVGQKVYMIKGNLKGGGGTGFAVKAPSGQSYIVTNAHVCEGALEQSEDKSSLLVINENGTMRRRIIEKSDFTDLCLLEGMPGVNGLTLGSEPGIGETVAVVGHPRLRPLSLSRGEIVGATDVEILAYIMKGNPFIDAFAPPGLVKDLKCDLPKNKLETADTLFGPISVCLEITKNAYMSTAVIFPGNSGSPVVDFWGRVEGVAFASDGTNWALIVSLKDLKQFISRY